MMMTADLVAAHRYLTPSSRSFWEWAHDGSAIEWGDGTTIAFRQELIGILSPLANEGLPPFDMIALVLSVCRDSWQSDPNQRRILDEFLAMLAVLSGRESFPKALWPNSLQGEFDLHRGLENIARLSPWIRTSIGARSELLAMLIPRGPLRTSPDVAKCVVEELRNGYPEEPFTEPQRPSKPTDRWLHELRQLSIALQQRIDEDALRLRVDVGLDELPGPADLDETDEKLPPTSTGDLLKDLEQDPDLYGFARLTRQLMAVVHLPRPMGIRDELPLGGVSDITNRGPLDQLLLSELANDDDVLMTRVALKEALYLRRETPPSRPPRERVMFIDAGLRMWGLPRIFSTSIALALSEMSPGGAQAYRAAGARIEEVDLSTKEGLTKHLESLRPEIHPGAALPEFRRTIEESEQEIVLIVGEDTLADGEFREQLLHAELPDLFLASVNREGRFRLTSKTRRGERLVREAQLDLEVLFEKPPGKKEPLRDPDRQTRLPAILRQRTFPLRLPHTLVPERTYCVPAGAGQGTCVLSVPHDGRLMLWDVQSRYARQLSDRIPPGEILRVDEDAGIVRMIVGQSQQGNLSLVWIDLKNSDVQIVPLETEIRPIRAVCLHAGAIFVMGQQQVDICHGTDGHLRHSLKVSGRTWLSERFFGGPDGLFAASYDGLSPRLECLIKKGDFPKDRWVRHVFDSRVYSGPVVIYSDGSYQFPPLEPINAKLSLTTPIRVAGVSRAGHRVVLAPDDGRTPGVAHLYAIKLDSHEYERIYHSPEQQLREPYERYVTPASLRVKIRGIGILTRTLVFYTGSSRKFSVELDGNHGRIYLQELPRETELKLYQEFDGALSESNSSFSNQFVEWSDGSRIWLDSRGLLHFQSSDVGVAEFTLALKDTNMGGWRADGVTWGGAHYALRDNTIISPLRIWTESLVPFVGALR
ncbi:MAG: hypothetical protein KDA80_01265 [Planctomycetaceae bacterium]|nr:hypothetical protein [Planctomycetaceae bacterium]